VLDVSSVLSLSTISPILGPLLMGRGEWDRRLQPTSGAILYALGCRVRGRPIDCI
jgi:hypothetical protein